MKHSRSSLFLMEMIIAILFFSLASAVCIQLFAKSHTLSKQTVNQNHAVIQAQNLAESYLALEGNLEQLTALFDTAVTDSAAGKLQLYFDGDWNYTSASDAFYTAELCCHPINENGLITADIIVSELSTSMKEQDISTSEIYSLQVAHHIAERRGKHE